jgi:hypothetical protein
MKLCAVLGTKYYSSPTDFEGFWLLYIAVSITEFLDFVRRLVFWTEHNLFTWLWQQISFQNKLQSFCTYWIYVALCM